MYQWKEKVIVSSAFMLNQYRSVFLTCEGINGITRGGEYLNPSMATFFYVY